MEVPDIDNLRSQSMKLIDQGRARLPELMELRKQVSQLNADVHRNRSSTYDLNDLKQQEKDLKEAASAKKMEIKALRESIADDTNIDNFARELLKLHKERSYQKKLAEAVYKEIKSNT